MNPRVSVITIFYNAADFLGEAVESVLAQDYRDFELLLVDDGSTDASAAIAQGFAEREPGRVRCLHHPGRVNRGMSAARNLGIREACGELIAFIDADDRWRNDKLGEQVAILDRHSEADACCGAVNYWRSWNGGTDVVVPTGHVQDRTVSPPQALLSWYPVGQAHAPSMSDLLMRTASVRAVNGFESSFTGPYEDQAFLTKFYLQSAIRVSTKVWSDYRLHDRSCMATTIRQGRYDEVRKGFLEWFAAYLADRPQLQQPAVTAALNRALFPYRHPLAGRTLHTAGRLLRKIARA